MKRNAIPGMVISVCILAVAAFLLHDSVAYSMYPGDPLTGRLPGSYTRLEILVGVNRPSIIRMLELGTGLLLVVVSIALSIRRKLK